MEVGIFWVCGECNAAIPHDDYDPDDNTLYECGSCGTVFTRANSADGMSHRCPQCNKMSGKLSENGCPECGEAEVETKEGMKCPHCSEFIEKE